ncbi:MAG: diguanylate cyclase [Phycisphaerales bacterium]
MTHDAPPQPEARPRVLIIDDLVDVHRLISVRLRAEGLDFFGALSGEEGLAKAAAESPALILLDLELGSVHGLTVLKGLKASATTQDIPVIIISGNQHAHEKVKAFDLGAVDYVTKPFEMTELRVRIRQALKMRHLVQMLAQRAQVDGLTGLWNRAFFNKRWAEEVERSARHGHTLSVAMLDIDHFKSINDTYGHSAGDTALQGVAKIIQRCCRNHDLVCRYGGEEFVIVMPETCPADAAIMGERIRHAIELEEWPRHPQRRLTASIGICGTTSATVGSAESIVEQADQNLYTGKHSGRNRVIWTDWKAPPAVGGMAA